MRTRGIVALAVVAVMVVGGLGLHSVSTRAAHEAPASGSASGSWYCPHGGGDGWNVQLAVTNPGSDPTDIRLTDFDRDGATEARRITVPPTTVIRVAVPAASRGATTSVEYFDSWVGVSWIAQGGGDESGIASEPCTPVLGRSWLLPDGGDLDIRGEDSWVVVMNPTAAPAFFTVRVITEQEAIATKKLTDILLRPGRSTSFHLNDTALGRRTVTAEVDVTIGRVAASTIGAGTDGGIRAALGIPGSEHAVTIPGGPEAGRNEIVVMNPGPGRSSVDARMFREDGVQSLGQFRGESLQPGQARTYDVAAEPLSALHMEAAGDAGFGVIRRTFGPASDQGSSAGAAAARAWVIPSADLSSKDEWRLVLTNPGTTNAEVSLWLLSPNGLSERLSPRVLNVAPGRSRAVGADFTEAAKAGAVVAIAKGGTFVPLATSYTSGGGYAAAVGVRIPERWIPSDLR